MSKETKLKIKFYIISILILLVLAVFIDIKLFDTNGAFLGVYDLICCNWFSIISIVFIIMGFIFLLLQNHELNGAANPCCRITKIENVSMRFKSHLIPFDLLKDATYDGLSGETLEQVLRSDYEQFKNERAKLFKIAIGYLCNGDDPSLDNIWNEYSLLKEKFV